MHSSLHRSSLSSPPVFWSYYNKLSLATFVPLLSLVCCCILEDMTLFLWFVTSVFNKHFSLILKTSNSLFLDYLHVKPFTWSYLDVRSGKTQSKIPKGPPFGQGQCMNGRILGVLPFRVIRGNAKPKEHIF